MDWDGIIEDGPSTNSGHAQSVVDAHSDSGRKFEPGVRAPLAVQVHASTPEHLQAAALRIGAALQQYPAVALFLQSEPGGNYLDIDLHSDAPPTGCAPSSMVRQTACRHDGGYFWDGQPALLFNFGIPVIFGDPTALGSVWVQSLRGPIPLSEVADVTQMRVRLSSALKTHNPVSCLCG